jgi:hypothetical protein
MCCYLVGEADLLLPLQGVEEKGNTASGRPSTSGAYKVKD